MAKGLGHYSHGLVCGGLGRVRLLGEHGGVNTDDPRLNIRPLLAVARLAKELNVALGIAASRRQRDDVVKLQIVYAPTRCAFSFVSSPNKHTNWLRYRFSSPGVATFKLLKKLSVATFKLLKKLNLTLKLGECLSLREDRMLHVHGNLVAA